MNTVLQRMVVGRLKAGEATPFHQDANLTETADFGVCSRLGRVENFTATADRRLYIKK